VIATVAIKRLSVAIAGAGILCLAIIGVAALLISPDTVRDSVRNEIRNATGLDLVLHGSVAVSLFPTGSADFSDVTLGEGEKPALAANRLSVRLRFFPLLIGRIEVADVTLVDALARALSPEADKAATASSFTEIRIVSGTISLTDTGRGLAESFDDVNLALAWPAISKGFAATGQMAWRGETLDSSITLTDFAASLSGGRSGVKLRLAGSLAKFAFDGNMSTKPTLKVEGIVAADAISLQDTLRWAGFKPVVGNGFGRFALKSKASLASGTIALSGVNVELDGNVAEGVLTFATDGRQTLQGTLAVNELNLTPYVSGIRLLNDTERDWNRGPFALDDLSGFDFDLRLSAARILLPRGKLGRTAIAANLRHGRLDVTIGEAQAFGGVLKGALSLVASNANADFKSKLYFSDVDLAQCLGELFKLRRLEGRGDIAFDIDATGNSALAMMRAMNGSVHMVGRQGSISGINLEQLLRRLERRPLSGAGDFRQGRTPYDKLAANIKIFQGTATVENISFEGSKVRFEVLGSASIPTREFDLRGVAALVAAPTDTTPAFELPFVVQGPWDDPIMLPDTQILMQRSPAAGPLLNAIKNRNTRDTVRSVIERFTGGTPGTPAAATPP
jgi:AsmA protein